MTVGEIIGAVVFVTACWAIWKYLINKDKNKEDK